MNLDWQTAAVGALIAAACTYLVRAAWQTVARKKAAACGGCDSCPSDAGPGGPEVVSLGNSSEKPPGR